MFRKLDFFPFPGMSSPHLQMAFSNFSPPGQEPTSLSRLVQLDDGDQISLQCSTPPQWHAHSPTIVMVHGLGGSHLSGYMIRLSRKFFNIGFRVVRVNLRGCGSGAGFNKLTYNSGNSHDVLAVLKTLKKETPLSSIHLLGFSLGGNISLKLAGELGEQASKLITRIIAICPPLDLTQCIKWISRKKNWVYQKYYLKHILQQGLHWTQDKKIKTIYEFDEKVTAPLWGYDNPHHYYESCSSRHFIPKIKIQCDLIFAADDPFIDHHIIKEVKVTSTTTVWLTPAGGHMGFIGWSGKEHGVYWLDKLLLSWLT